MDKTFDEQALEIRKEMVMNFPNDPYDEKWAAEFARRIRDAVLTEGGAREPIGFVAVDMLKLLLDKNDNVEVVNLYRREDCPFDANAKVPVYAALDAARKGDING